MEQVAAQAGIAVAVLLACFLGPAFAFAFLLRRKRQARARRRSPIGIDLLRSPGHSLREQLEKEMLDISFELGVLMVVPLLMMTVFLAQGHLAGMRSVIGLAPFFAAAAIGFIGWTIRKLWMTAVRLDNLRAGYDAELAVGQELDQLMRQGAAVFHDFPAEQFNIDHVVIAAQGVFAVETKGFTKPRRHGGKADATVVFDGKSLKFPTWTTKDPLEQAERQAAWLAKWVSAAAGSQVGALPVLALPGWFVERTGRGSVRVFSGKELAGLLRSKGGQALSPLQIQQVAYQVEQRCRTVAPLYAEVDKVT